MEYLLAFGLGPTIAAALLVSAALVAFPMFYWIQDRRRRGLPLSTAGVIGAAMLGLLAVGIIVMFMWLRP